MTFEMNSEDKPSDTNIFNLGLDSKFYDVAEKNSLTAFLSQGI